LANFTNASAILKKLIFSKSQLFLINFSTFCLASFLFYQKIAQKAILLKSSNPVLLGLADDFKTLRWEEVFGYPEGVLKQMKELLARA